MTDVDPGERMRMTRRALLTRGAALSAGAWAAPAILHSSLAGAATCSDLPIVRNIVAGWAKGGGASPLTVSTGNGSGSINPTTGAGATGSGTEGHLVAEANDLVVVLVGIADVDNNPKDLTFAAPFTGLTQVAYEPGATNAPWFGGLNPNFTMRAYTMVAPSGVDAAVEATCTDNVVDMTIIAAAIDVSDCPVVVGSAGSDRGLDGYTGVTWKRGSNAVSQPQQMVLFGMVQESFAGLTGGSPGTGTSLLWQDIIGYSSLGPPAYPKQVLATSPASPASSALQQRIAFYFGPSAASVTSASALNVTGTPLTPTVVGANAGADNFMTTSKNIVFNAAPSAGELLLVFYTDGSVGTSTLTAPAGFSTLYNTAQNNTRGACFYKIADGTETATVQATLSVAERCTFTTYRISGYAGAPEAGTSSPGVFFASGTTATPNPPSCTPSWGPDNTLWIAAAHVNKIGNGETVSGSPASYVNPLSAQSSNGSGSTNRMRTVQRAVNTATEDPGTFTLSSGATAYDWVAGTIAIRPGNIARWATLAFEIAT